MIEVDPVKIGVMWQKVEAMEHEVSELRADVKELLIGLSCRHIARQQVKGYGFRH